MHLIKLWKKGIPFKGKQMGQNKRDYIIYNLMNFDFISKENKTVILQEEEETGKSELVVDLKDQEYLCIKNLDKKHTELYFFNNQSQLSMYKRVDHILFEHNADDKWIIHLIEMKSSVAGEKWVEIRGKFRASYLLAKAIAAILDMEIAQTIMYTTYERVSFQFSKTLPSARRGRSGAVIFKMEDEWNGGKFGLNLGDRVPFQHIPISMNRKSEEGLFGRVSI